MSATLIWSALTSRLAGPVASAFAVALACFLVAALLGHAAQRTRAEFLLRERDGWKVAAGRWEASARGLQASFEEAERLRRQETGLARVATEQAARTCETRIAAARRSARAIETIVRQEVPNDPKGCPDRRLVPVERLRDALAPAD